MGCCGYNGGFCATFEIYFSYDIDYVFDRDTVYGLGKIFKSKVKVHFQKITLNF